MRVSVVTHSYDEATGTMDTGYPRSIEDDFPGMDDEVDAAAFHYGTVKTTIHLLPLRFQRAECVGSIVIGYIGHCYILFRVESYKKYKTLC